MNVLENLLVTLMEECSEVAKAASKILRAGADSAPPGRHTTNLQELQAELQDLYGVVAELAENGLFVGERDPSAIHAKRVKLRHFIAVSRELGYVQGPLAYREGRNPEETAPFAYLTIPDPVLERRRMSVLEKTGFDCSKPHTPADFAEQYQCTPVSTVKQVIDLLLNETNFSREYLEELALGGLLDLLRLYPENRDLYRELRKHINSLPEVKLPHGTANKRE